MKEERKKTSWKNLDKKSHEEIKKEGRPGEKK